MSYILDALRKADAERDRGNVPGIHAQPSFGGALPTQAPRQAPPWLWLAAGALGVILVGGVGWFVLGNSGRTPTERAAVASNAGPVTPTLPPPVAAPAPAAVVPNPPAPGSATPPTVSSHTVTRSRSESAPPTRKPRPVTAASAPSTSAPTATPDGRPAANAEKVYALNELPDDIRRQLPSLAVGGSMYSSKPADRLLILNGQVVHEGDHISPDLVLQQIRLKSALLNFKGYRYTLGF